MLVAIQTGAFPKFDVLAVALTGVADQDWR